MIDENTIQAIGNSPYAAPVSADISASGAGMPIGDERQDECDAERRQRRHPRRLAPARPA